MPEHPISSYMVYSLESPYLDSILPRWEMGRPLLRLLQSLLTLVLAQTSSNSPGLLWSEIQG
jgi:hypothetical protein